MTRVSHADDPEARRLHEAIAAELIALRQALPFQTRGPVPGADIADRIGNIWRSNPAWAAGAVAGALAGVVAAVRRRHRVSMDAGAG